MAHGIRANDEVELTATLERGPNAIFVMTFTAPIST